MKKVATIISSVVAAFFVAVVLLLCLERVPVGYVGVVYSARGVEQNTLSQGWHFLSPMKHVSKFPISQQQLIFSDAPTALERTARWIAQDDTFTRFECSRCHTKNHHTRWDYCPSCGAKMENAHG